MQGGRIGQFRALDLTSGLAVVIGTDDQITASHHHGPDVFGKLD
jgi:hypothetical protein